MATLTDPLNGTTRYQYDAFGRQTHETDTLGDYARDPFHTIETRYDDWGNVAAVTDQMGPGGPAQPQGVITVCHCLLVSSVNRDRATNFRTHYRMGHGGQLRTSDGSPLRDHLLSNTRS